MQRELYIYWKVAAAQRQQALQATHELQSCLLQRHSGLLARLLQRDDATTAAATLMEIYSLPGGITAAVQQDIEAQAALHLTPLGPPAVQRHMEVFFEPR